jgi:Fe-S-cluster containining protein
VFKFWAPAILFFLSLHVQHIGFRSIFTPRYIKTRFIFFDVMSLSKKVVQVEKLYQELDRRLALFRSKSGLSCASECGRCCKKPDIEAWAIEFLPLAYRHCLEGTDQPLLNKIVESPDQICILFSPFILDKGFCNHYNYRGAICRLFGFSAVIDKYGQRRLSTCKTIKEQSTKTYIKASEMAREWEDMPTYQYYYQKLQEIEPSLCHERLPINKAIRAALGYVMNRFYYENEDYISENPPKAG